MLNTALGYKGERMKMLSLVLIFGSSLALVGLGALALVQGSALNVIHLALPFLGLFAGFLTYPGKQGASGSTD